MEKRDCPRSSSAHRAPPSPASRRRPRPQDWARYACTQRIPLRPSYRPLSPPPRRERTHALHPPLLSPLAPLSSSSLPGPRVLLLLPLERNTTPGRRQSKRFLSRGRPRLVLVVFASSVPVDRRGEGIRPGVWIGLFSTSIW